MKRNPKTKRLICRFCGKDCEPRTRLDSCQKCRANPDNWKRSNPSISNAEEEK